MYPNLYYLIKDLFGIEIGFLKIFQSFGVMVAVAFLLAAYFFSKELKRKEKEGLVEAGSKKILKGEPPKISEIALSAFFGFIIFYKLVYIVLNFSEFTEDTQGFILSARGNLLGGIAGAILLGYSTYRDKKKQQLPKPELVTVTVHPYEHVPNMTLIAAVAGILGAKLFHNFENWNDFISDPVGSLFSFSGLTMYGGLIVAGAAVIYYAYKNGIKIPHLIDACAPALMLAYGVGRIGCHIAGDGDWGIVNTMEKPSWFILPDWAWAHNYPNNVNKDCGTADCIWAETPFLVQPVFPTPLWEAIICTGLFFVLWSLRKRIVVPGMLFSIYLILNGTERFFIEKIRVNNPVLGMNVTQAEIISVLLILLGIAGIIYFRKFKNASQP